jgi:hypothetical protein
MVSFTLLPLYPRKEVSVGPRAYLDDMEKGKFLTLPGLTSWAYLVIISF